MQRVTARSHPALWLALVVAAACGGADVETPPAPALLPTDAAPTPTGSVEAGVDGGAAVGEDARTDSGVEDARTDGGVEDAPDASAPSCTRVVDNTADLVAALGALAPGTTLCVADGTYADVAVSFVAQGTALQPIVITAEHPGRALFNGQTRLSMGGAHATLRGLRLEGGQSQGSSLVELRSGTTFCDDCRLTELAIVGFDAGNAADVKWVSLYGQRDRVDHCVFSGKTNPGTVLVVWRSSGRADEDRVDHNLFENRPPLPSNGNEAIRIGTGAEASSDSLTTVEDNLFVAMSGDAEIVSVKSGANVLRHNTFQRCEGQVTLRNGAGSTVDGNVFLTEGLVDAGGIRVIGPRHRITNNYVEGVRTNGAARGGLVLMSGDGTSGGGGYAQVEDVLVAFNTVVDSDHSLIFGADANPLAPARLTFANNLVYSARVSVVSTGIGLTDASLFGNEYFGAPLGFAPAGFVEVDAQLTRGPDGLMRPSATSPALGAATSIPGVTTDIDGRPRTATPDVGCAQRGGSPTRAIVTRADVGPQTWSPSIP